MKNASAFTEALYGSSWTTPTLVVERNASWEEAYFWDVTQASNKNLKQYRGSLAKLLDLLAEGRIDPTIGEVMALRDAPKAQQMLLDYQVQGKVVLVASD